MPQFRIMATDENMPPVEIAKIVTSFNPAAEIINSGLGSIVVSMPTDAAQDLEASHRGLISLPLVKSSPLPRIHRAPRRTFTWSPS